MIVEPPEKFGLIYADPGWQYDTKLPTVRRPQEVYHTMPMDEIGAIPVERWVKRNALLAMWVTNPMMFDALTRVMIPWGFQFKTLIPWIKAYPTWTPRRTAGPYVMQCSEMLVIATRGDVGVWKREEGKGLLGLLEGLGDNPWFWDRKPERHSGKPEMRLIDYLETFGHLGPPCELFAIKERENWVTWGAETGFWLDKTGVRKGGPPADPQGGLFE